MLKMLNEEQKYNNAVCNLLNEYLQDMWAMHMRAGYHNGTYLWPAADVPGAFAIRFPGATRGVVHLDKNDRIESVELFDTCFNPGVGVYRIELVDAVRKLVGRPLLEVSHESTT